MFFSLKSEREAGNKTGGLGSSHTTPCGAAVPARPPTRSSETTQLSCEPQWVRRATEQGTRVVVQGGHAEPKTKLPPLSKQLIISKMGGRTQRLLWSALPIVLTQFWSNPAQLFADSVGSAPICGPSMNQSFIAVARTSGHTWIFQGKERSTKRREHFASRICIA